MYLQGGQDSDSGAVVMCANGIKNSCHKGERILGPQIEKLLAVSYVTLQEDIKH